MELEKTEFLENIIIKPECISIDNKTELNSKEGTTIKKIKKQPHFKKRLIKLVDFIKKSHLYYGKSCLRSYIKTIIPNIGYDPVLSPKTYATILRGLDFGLKYIIRTDKNGACTFLKLNMCSIHEIKPTDCKQFPYNKDGTLRKDHTFISICNGLKRM